MPLQYPMIWPDHGCNQASSQSGEPIASCLYCGDHLKRVVMQCSRSLFHKIQENLIKDINVSCEPIVAVNWNMWVWKVVLLLSRMTFSTAHRKSRHQCAMQHNDWTNEQRADSNCTGIRLQCVDLAMSGGAEHGSASLCINKITSIGYFNIFGDHACASINMDLYWTYGWGII